MNRRPGTRRRRRFEGLRARGSPHVFGDSQFPSQSQDLSEEEVSDPEEDGRDPEEDGCDPEEDGYTPLAVRRAPRARKPRKFFGDSQFPSQSQDDSKEQDEEEEEEEDDEDEEDAVVEVSSDEEMENEGPARASLSPLAEEDEEDDERVEAPAEEEEEDDDDDEMWYVGGTQAFPDAPPGDSEEDADEDDAAAAADDDAPLPPMDDDDDDDGRLNEATGVVRSNHSWTGPLPEIGCPKCRFAAKGCGRCRAIRAHAEFGTPLPWGGTVRVGTNVRGRGRSARRPPRRLDRRLQRNARVDPHRRRPFAAFVSTTTRPAGDSRPSSPRPPGNADASSPRAGFFGETTRSSAVIRKRSDPSPFR